jgi:integrase
MNLRPMTAAQACLVAEYAQALRELGEPVTAWTMRCARDFVAEFGDRQSWAALPVAARLPVRSGIRGFITWMLVTGRAAAEPEYLMAARPQLGHTAARHHPEFFARFSAASRPYEPSRRRAWTALAHICALTGTVPPQINASTINTAGRILLDAEDRAPSTLRNLRHDLRGMSEVLALLGLLDATDTALSWLPAPAGPNAPRPSRQLVTWPQAPPGYVETVTRYLTQIRISLRPASVLAIDQHLRGFGGYLAVHHPEVGCVRDLHRPHLEAYKSWLAEQKSNRGGQLNRRTIGKRLATLRTFFDRISEWGYHDAPTRPLVFSGDLPIPDAPLPRFLDDASAALLLRAARAHPDPLVGLVVEFLARTGLRRSELLDLPTDAVVQIGSAYWLRVPVGKLHTDRYIPLHPQLKSLLDEWIAERPECRTLNRVLVERRRPVPYTRIGAAVAAAAKAAGIDHVTPHQLRHTLATQAINRGMSLEAIAALLGHRSMTMTMTYARIADRTVANEYFAVSEKVEALYDQTAVLPAAAEGHEMRKLRAEMHRRMLGNGYCARPVELDCHFESICESCTFFVTTIEFRPTLQAQRDDAANKGQIGRQQLYDGILARLDNTAS